MASILDEIMKLLPKEAEISEACFEGANIILYTKSKDFFLDNKGIIKNVVDNIKKRVELRCDPSMVMDLEKAETSIKKLLPEEARVGNINFDPQRAVVAIESEKPGLAIGKQGEILKEIRKKTLWVPTIVRMPALRSKIIENIRQVLYEHSDYRKKFLNKIGHRIYDGWVRGKKNEWVRVTYLGGARQVGRSCILLQTQESRVLLDCGVNVAANDQDAYPYFDVPEFKLEELDAVILSHAHLDHGGVIPALFKMGYRGPVYCTAPTRDISALLALDFIGVAFKQANKSLFSSTDVKEMMKHTITLDYGEVTDITPDIRITLYNAGHVLGSSLVHLHIGNGLHNLLYSGDLKYARSNLLDAAETRFPRLETVLIESTYGGKDNILKSRQETESEIFKIINNHHKLGGKILIPVLGVGRAQEISMLVDSGIRRGLIPKIPVFVQGMVWDVTAIHTAYPDFLNGTIRKAIFHDDQNPFLSDVFKRVGSRKEQQEVIEDTGSCIIIATSGMMTAGPSVEYFRNLADNPKNALLFVSYQGEGCLGRKIQDGERHFVLTDAEGKPETVDVKMAVYIEPGLTGHSTRPELMNYVKHLNPKPRRVLVNHGESSRCLDLAASLHKAYKIETSAPRNLETVRLR